MAEIRLATKLAAPPRRSVFVYRLRKPTVSERSVRALARELGMEVDPKRAVLAADATKLVLTSGMFELRVFRASGGFRFIDRSRWQVDDGKTNLRISDRVALQQAQRIVKELALAAARETQFLKAARLRVGSATSRGKEATERTVDVAVALQRMVDKIPVDGPGGKIIVYMDAKGLPTGIERIWRPLGAALGKPVKLRSPDMAIEELAEHYRSRQAVLTVEDVRFGYVEEGARSEQPTLQPAYVIRGLVGEPEDRVRRRLIYVARAVADAKAPLTPPIRRKAPQPARKAGRR